MIPELIFIIGPSCSGKSSLSRTICRINSKYSVLDDVSPLYKIFQADTLWHQHQTNSFFKLIKENDLECYYDKKKPLPYSYPNVKGGYLIDNPATWNIVLEILGKQIKNKYTIVEFSRGSDKDYNAAFNISDDDVYPLSFSYLCQNINHLLLEKALILNIDAPLEIRKSRNRQRFEQGGHLVAENTMDTIYEKNIFKSEQPYFFIKDIKIPVFSIKNDKNSIDISDFFIKEFQNAIKFYQGFHNDF